MPLLVLIALVKYILFHWLQKILYGSAIPIVCLIFAVNEDYVGISRTLEFAPGITMQKVKVAILDDLGGPVLEGPETFDLALSMPMGAVLGAPSIATVVINDSVSDRKF